MAPVEAPILVRCLSRSWSTAHLASSHTPQVNDVSEYFNKQKVSSRLSARLVTILISRQVTDQLIDALPNLIKPTNEPHLSESDPPPSVNPITWPLAVVASSIPRSTLKVRLPFYTDPFQSVIQSLQSLALPPSIEHSLPSLATPLEILSTSLSLKVNNSGYTAFLEYQPLTQPTNYNYQGEPSLLNDSLKDLQIQTGREPSKPPPSSRSSSHTLPTPLSSIPFSRSRHGPLTPLGKGRPNAFTPELSRRRAFSSNKATDAALSGVSAINLSANSAPTANVSQELSPNASFDLPAWNSDSAITPVPGNHVQGVSPTDVVILDDDDDDIGDEGDVVAAAANVVQSEGHFPGSSQALSRRNNNSALRGQQSSKVESFRRKLRDHARKEQDTFSNDNVIEEIPLPPPSDTFFAREQDRQRKKREKMEKRKAFRAKEEELKKERERRRREKKLKSIRRNSKTITIDEEIDGDESGSQREPASKKARTSSNRRDVRLANSGSGVGNSQFTIDLVTSGDCTKQETELGSLSEGYERERSNLMDLIKGHTANLSDRDATKIESFLKGENIFGRHASIDILLHHDCGRSGNNHYLRLVKEPRRVEQVFRTNVL